jgi:hypothetical protein
MIRNTAVDKQARQQRLAAKTPDSQFCRAIEAGANIPPFVSESILQVAREVYRLDPNDLDKQLDLGQVKLLVVAADEPAGKPLERCQKVPVLLTLDAGQDDFQLRVQQGLEGLRRARLLRMTLEARDQGGFLTYEDLAYRLLNCSERTIVRDIRALRKRHLEVPTRGQQQDIGPGQTHRVQAVRLYLQGLEAEEIARRLYHTLPSIENYVNTFSRVLFLVHQGWRDSDIAYVLHRSTALVAAYRQLYADFKDVATAQLRLGEIVQRPHPALPVHPPTQGGKSGKKGRTRP